MSHFFIKKIDADIFPNLMYWPWVLFYQKNGKIYPWQAFKKYSDCKARLNFEKQVLRSEMRRGYELNEENRTRDYWGTFYQEDARNLALFMMGKYIKNVK